MKKRLIALAALVFISLAINSCTQPKSLNPVEDNINTQASTDKFADLGNKVWIDTNKDGIKQKPEAGFAGIVINLYKDINKDGKADGPVFMTDTTNAKGYYRFNAIDPDINYVLEIVVPDGYKLSVKNAETSGNPGKDYDSDFKPSTGFSDSIDVLKGRYFYWYDAALQATGNTNTNPASVGDKIWLDTNKDGIKQRAEAGLANITLNLWLDTSNNNKPDKKISSTQTNSKGNYKFSNLNPNLNYYVEIELPANYKVSQKHNPDAKGKDWDNDFDVNAFTDKLKLTEGKFNYWLADGAIYKGVSDPSVCSDPIYIPDNVLQLALEGSFQGSVTCAKLASVKSLFLGPNIHDLTGLQYAKNVEVLDLSRNKITDLSPIAGLTKLKNLNIAYNRITNLSALANLTNLEILYAYKNQITDISGLSTKLSKLYKIALHVNQITDISALSNLTNIGMLNLNYNQIVDVSPLKDVPNLSTLLLIGNNIGDISALVSSSLSNANTLKIMDNCLDINSGADIDNIHILESRGVYVSYSPQKDCN